MRWSAWLVIVATFACGRSPSSSSGDGGTIEDASPDDGAANDGPEADANADGTPLPVIPPAYECDVHQPGMVKVRTYTPSSTLLIHNVFGSLITRTTSGPTAIVDVLVPGCGSVTMIGPGIYHTVTHVRGGDDLWIATPPDLPQPGQGPARVYIDSVVAGATYYSGEPFYTSLVANEPAAIDLTWNKHKLTSQGLATVVVHANFPGESETNVLYSVFDNVSMAAAIQTPLHVTSWRTQTSAYQLRMMLATPVDVANTFLFTWANDVLYEPRYAHLETTPATFSSDFVVPTYGDGLLVGGSFVGSLAAPSQARGYEAVIPRPSTATIPLDLTEALLPELLTTSVSTSPSRPEFSWTTGPSTVTPDLVILWVGGPLQWRIALPPGATSYRLPELPADLAKDFSAVIDCGVSLHEASDQAGYAVARARYVGAFIAGRKYPMGLVLRWSKINNGL